MNSTNPNEGSYHELSASITGNSAAKYYHEFHHGEASFLD
jgi:hypothetical protein